MEQLCNFTVNIWSIFTNENILNNREHRLLDRFERIEKKVFFDPLLPPLKKSEKSEICLNLSENIGKLDQIMPWSSSIISESIFGQFP